MADIISARRPSEGLQKQPILADNRKVKKLIPHDHPARIAWNILMLVVTLVFLFIITYRIVFRTFTGDALYYTLNLLFVADIFFNFCTKVKLGHIRLETFEEVKKHYLHSWFIVDLLAAFPFELVIVIIFGPVPQNPRLATPYLLLQSLTLVKLFKAGRIFNELEESLRIIPALKRLIMVGYWLSMALHLMALGWILIGAGEAQGPAIDRYIRAFYWVTTTIATIGYGDYTPDHAKNVQILYTILVEIFGVGMFSYIIANVSSLVSNLDVARSAYQHRLDEVNAYLRAQRIPAELQDRVRDYYSYLWTKQRGVSATTVLSDIPPSLTQEILMFLNREVLNRVAIFRGADELFIRESVQLLQPRVFLPGEYIIRQGEFGDCMYFLTSGEVQVVINGTQVATLGPGSPFGETALLENLHRNASIISVSYSTGYQLSKGDFDELRAKYPDFDRQVREVAAQRK
jgi:voltage-gated potassium channel